MARSYSFLRKGFKGVTKTAISLLWQSGTIHFTRDKAELLVAERQRTPSLIENRISLKTRLRSQQWHTTPLTLLKMLYFSENSESSGF
jgi:hypothetical protein